MSIPYIQSTMQEARVVDGSFISYPFLDSGDTQTKVFTLICTQLASYYDAAQIDLDTPMSSAAAAGVIDLPTGWVDSTAYFVGDTNFQSNGSGMLSFTRTFANIPQTNTAASGSESYTFPGVIWPIPYFTTSQVPASITNIQTVAGQRGLVFTCDNPHLFVAGDYGTIKAEFEVQGGDGFLYTIAAPYIISSISSDYVFTADVGYNFDSQVILTLKSGRVSTTNLGREKLPLTIPITTRYQYILPGITPWVSDVNDIEVPRKFSPVFESGASVDDTGSGKLSVTYTVGPVTVRGTVPSATEYYQMIKDGANLIIESSLSEWAGNILVLKTKTCKAK